jgi:hypothetical protein
MCLQYAWGVKEDLALLNFILSIAEMKQRGHLFPTQPHIHFLTSSWKRKATITKTKVRNAQDETRNYELFHRLNYKGAREPSRFASLG